MSKLPKYYSQVCKNKPDDYLQYESFNIKLGNHQRYEIQHQVGRGNYSDVFQGSDLTANKPVIIKFLKPVKMIKVKREIKILQLLNGLNNTIKLLDVVKFPNQKAPSLVFEYIKNACEQDFRKFYASLDERDVKHYMLELLKALDYINSKGIMHRDIKPHNIVIDHEKKKLKLIDFGLAEYYVPNQEYNVRVASRYFKGPELLLDNPIYDYSVDIWSLGCLFAGIIFKQEPFFAGEDNLGQLVKITKVVGTEEILQYMAKYDLELNDGIELAHYDKKPLSSFVNDKNRSRISDEALDLLEKMLEVDHAKRITPRDAMRHPYFQIRSKQSVPRPAPSELKLGSASKQMYLKGSVGGKTHYMPRYQSPQPWTHPPESTTSPRHQTYFATATKTDRRKDQGSLTQKKEVELDRSASEGKQSSTAAHQAAQSADVNDEEQCELPDSNINVVVRVRPILQKEKDTNEMCIISTTDNNQVQIMDPKDFIMQQSQDLLSAQGDSQNCYYRTSFNNAKRQSSSFSSQNYERNYSFDMVFGSKSSNREIYDSVIKNMTKVVLGGYNATIFAYGVTGAGKTHTMIGYEDEPGLMYYTVNDMFEGMKGQTPMTSSRKQGHVTSEFKIEVSFLEIYNEQIRDLIVPQAQPLELREDPQSGVQINGLSVFEVTQKDQIFELLAKGNANRTQEQTRQNQTSSRSHAVLIIKYRKDCSAVYGSESQLAKSGKLSLIDLAGSERASKNGNTGQRMKEGACINKSLLALGNCINLLYENARCGQHKHVPFRDSKLTRILKESLIGNSKTLMIANVSPASQNYEDTLNTLKYANRTKDLKTKIKKNIVAQSNQQLIEQQNQHINNLQNEIESLRAELALQKKQQLQQQQEEEGAMSRLQSITQVRDDVTTDEEDDKLFLEIKKRIIEQFNVENYCQSELKNLYIEYENLLFQQKMMKINAFVQENQELMSYQRDYQQIHLMQNQLIQLAENEQLLSARIDDVREKQKNQIRKRNQLKEYIYDQVKEIKKRDYYGQKTPRGQGLSRIQAEILETLFRSNEQQIQNTAMQMKEKRLNIKMAKKEYMINWMAQQVEFREFGNYFDLTDRQNILSKDQIDEVLRETENNDGSKSYRTVAMSTNPSVAYPLTIDQFSQQMIGAPPPLNLQSVHEYQLMQCQKSNEFLPSSHSQMNCYSEQQQQSLKKIFSKTQSRQRSRGSPSVEEFARNAKRKHSRNNSKSRSSFQRNFRSDGLPQQADQYHQLIQNQIYSTNDPSEAANSGIQLYQPQLKKKVTITNVFKSDSLVQNGNQNNVRSHSARHNEPLPSTDRIVEQMESQNKKPNELKDMQRQVVFKHPRKIYTTVTSNNQSLLLKDKKDNKYKSKKNDLTARNSSFNYQRAYHTSRGASLSKRSIEAKRDAPQIEKKTIYTQIISSLNHKNQRYQSTQKTKSSQIIQNKRKKDIDDYQPSVSETDNQHYFKRLHTYNNDSGPKEDAISYRKVAQANHKVKSETLLKQVQKKKEELDGKRSPSQKNTFISEMAKNSSINRKDLYRNARNSSKELKQQIRRASQSPELMQDIQVVIDDVNHRISEFEEYKSSFAGGDQEASSSQPNQFPFMSTKSATNDWRASSSDKCSTFNNQQQSMNLHQSIHGNDTAQKQYHASLYFKKGQTSSLRASMAAAKHRPKISSVERTNSNQ